MQKQMLLISFVFLMIALPVSAQETLPDNLAPITAGNIDQLQQVGTFGFAPLLDTGFVRGGESLAAVTLTGVLLLDPADMSAQDFIAFESNPFGESYPTFVQPGGGIFAESRVGVSFDGTTILIDLDTGEQTVSTGAAGAVQTLATRPDGSQALTAPGEGPNYTALSVIDTAAGTEIYPIIPDENGGQIRPLGAGYTADGTRFALLMIASGGRWLLQVWDAASGALLLSADLADEAERPVSVNVGGEDALVAFETYSVRYSLADLSELQRIEGTTLLATSPGNMLSAQGVLNVETADFSVQIVDASGAKVSSLPDPICTDFARHFFSPDGSRYYLYYLGGDAIRAYDTATGERVGASPAFGNYVGDVIFSADGGSLYAAGGNTRPETCRTTHNPTNGISQYALDSGAAPVAFLPTESAPDSLAVSGDLLVAAGFGGLDVWRGGEPVAFDPCPADTVCRADDVVFSADGARLVSYYGGDLNAMLVWDTAALTFDTPLAVLPGEAFIFRGNTAWAGDDLLYTADERTISLWDGTDSRVIFSLDDIAPADAPVFLDGFAYDPAGGRIAVQLTDRGAGSGSMVIVSLAGAAPEVVGQWAIMPDRWHMLFSPDGSLLVTSAPNGDMAGAYTVIYDAASGAPVFEMPRAVLPAAFNADGTLLAIANARYEIEVWGVPAN